jgi:hypothetical protein
MDCLAAAEHRDEFLDALRPRLRLLGTMDAIQAREAIAAVELGEKTFGGAIAIERGLQIAWYDRFALARIGRFPAPVALGLFDLAQAIGPSSIRASARSRFFCDHLPLRRRGVKRMSQWFASNESSCPSIQPQQRAPSIASCLVMLAMPDLTLASLSQMPLDVAGWAASHAVHSANDANASTRRSLLVFRNAVRSVAAAARGSIT